MHRSKQNFTSSPGASDFVVHRGNSRRISPNSGQNSKIYSASQKRILSVADPDIDIGRGNRNWRGRNQKNISSSLIVTPFC